MVTVDHFRALGEELKRARMARARSIDDIALQTKIHRRHIESIEAGDMSRLPQGPYVKAFVREFARAVGVPVPPEFMLQTGAPPPAPKDPKVVSHAVGERSAPITEVARETARFANTAMRTAVKSVTKTTESMVQMVETGSKEALEVLTSKSLWEEAEDVRRERHGLPPLVPVLANAGKAGIEHKPEENPTTEPAPLPAASPARASRAISKRATNVVIALLALLFAVAMFFTIRMYRGESVSSSVAKGDYVPAPVENPTLAPSAKHGSASITASAPHTAAVKDSLYFTLRAIQPVWVSISPDGQPAYRGQLRAGERQTFRAAEKIVLDIGNQKFVEIQLDGQRLSNLPTIQNSGVVIRNLVLMRNRVSMGGQELDFKKLTSAPAPAVAVRSVPVPPASSMRKNTAIAKPVTKAAVKPHSTQQAKPSTIPNAVSNAAASKPKPSKSKKGTAPSVELHSVEPVPPGP